MKVIDEIINSLRSSATYNPDIQVAPHCILWPDADRQWQRIIPRMKNELPELYILGNYSPEEKTGPAIWLRCIIAEFENDKKPILYLPGVSRQDLRAIESCPEYLKPLAELQYRGVFWSQANSKDWTVLAFLKSKEGGLGLDVAMDDGTKQSMLLALNKILDEHVEYFKGKRLDRNFFNNLITGGDPVKDLLLWINDEVSFKNSKDENEWDAFIEICKSTFNFNPAQEGVLAAATKLANHEGKWSQIWARFCEAPHKYENIPNQIRKCEPPTNTTTWHLGDESHNGWPQWNDEQELFLKKNLESLNSLPSHEVRETLIELNKQHSDRRKSVWAELGYAPYAVVLEHLTSLAELTKINLTAGILEDLTDKYVSLGWQADDVVISALSVTNDTIFSLVSSIIRQIYLPWLEDSAVYLQKVVDKAGYPFSNIDMCNPEKTDNTCYLFVDGLRFDVAKRLINALMSNNINVEEKYRWAALPTVTATGKPAVSPVFNNFEGLEKNEDFEPNVKNTGQSLKGGYHFRKILDEHGWTYEHKWIESGDIDHEGHSRGWKLCKHINNIIEELKDKVISVMNEGWEKIHIVTDHGWLLMPGGLPKVNLPKSLTQNKWGRCAIIKEGASFSGKLYPWFWNNNINISLADGISCFKKGIEYTHGGLSLQECLTIELNIDNSIQKKDNVEITDVVWKGLRCKIAVEGDFAGLSMDVRLNPGDHNSSVVLAVNGFKDNGVASVIVENEDNEGKAAYIVILDKENKLISQTNTVIGGE